MNKKLRNSKKDNPDKTDPVTEVVQVSEPLPEIKEIEEKLVPINDRDPDPHRYFVIIGSYRNPDNAQRFRSKILKEGISSEILLNEAGLYRISVLATDNITEAREDIRRIRRVFPEYSDTWLLIQKK
ncbi:MAG: SPOR domain-containing protein [Bacteroidales bacterium]|nr:SPOR domain-containing protein [Bacteroidales bacterium]